MTPPSSQTTSRRRHPRGPAGGWLPRCLWVPVALALLLLAAPPSGAATGPGAVDPVGVWPLAPDPVVVAGFDPPDAPWGAGHRGVDLLGAVGQPVRAALPGRVTWAGVLAGRGVVVVDHGATRTTYEPVDARVEVGAVVAAGDRIGLLSYGGSHCPPRACLHWGWIEGDTYLDPLRLVGAGPVRLLPLWRDAPVGASGPPLVQPLWRPSPLPYAGWRPASATVPAGTVGFTPAGAPAGRRDAAGRW